MRDVLVIVPVVCAVIYHVERDVVRALIGWIMLSIVYRLFRVVRCWRLWLGGWLGG